MSPVLRLELPLIAIDNLISSEFDLPSCGHGFDSQQVQKTQKAVRA
jgi:hypothetical protein